MLANELSQLLEDGKISPQGLCERLKTEPSKLNRAMDCIFSPNPAMEFCCAKALRKLSEQKPWLLYPYFNSFIDLLNHPNLVIRWQAIAITANLAAVDTQGMLDSQLDELFVPVKGPVMLTARRVISAALRIVESKPHLAELIAEKLLGVRHGRFESPECHAVVIESALEALGKMKARLEFSVTGFGSVSF